MTGAEIYDLWRPCGSKYWYELEHEEQLRWEDLSHSLSSTRGPDYRRGYDTGYSEGYDMGYSDAESEADRS
ncbi:Uncharacterised protein [Mycobacteroides abscessus subsp. abscessus]|nr:Uncharacterised protein [Mycobacteroides abscessus subsp. abscessus]